MALNNKHIFCNRKLTTKFCCQKFYIHRMVDNECNKLRHFVGESHFNLVFLSFIYRLTKYQSFKSIIVSTRTYIHLVKIQSINKW